MRRDGTVVIVGAGLMGAAAACSLTRRGWQVAVLEQFGAGHSAGSSHGSARIVRRAYGDELYTRLTGQAFELWRELESSSGTELLRMLSGLDFGPRRDVAGIASHLAAAAVPHEVVPALEAERRWAGMRFSGDVLFHPQAGTLDADAAVTAMLATAVAGGATVRYGVAVTAVHERADGGALVACSDGSQVSADVVVAAVGAWLEPLLGRVIALPVLRVTRQDVFHFPRVDRSAPAWPSVIHEDAWAFYHLAGGRDGGGFGTAGGHAAADDRKLGVHDGGTQVSTDDLGGADPAEQISDGARSRAVQYVREWLPGLDPTPRHETTCLYTHTPSEDFIVDRVGPVVVCSPCSGHGAKFAPLIGEYVADLLTGTGAGGGVPDRFSLATHRRGLPSGASL